MIFTMTIETPLGPLGLAATNRGLRCVTWSGTPMQATEAPNHPVLRRASAELRGYFRGDRTRFGVPLDNVGTPFQREAWRSLSDIPYGETRTYKEQAAAIGRPNAARAVGAANGRNPLSIVVPCHRVIGASGSLTGFAGGLERKRWLLDHENRARSSGYPLAPFGGHGTIALTSSMTSR